MKSKGTGNRERCKNGFIDAYDDETDFKIDRQIHKHLYNKSNFEIA